MAVDMAKDQVTFAPNLYVQINLCQLLSKPNNNHNPNNKTSITVVANVRIEGNIENESCSTT